MNKSNKKGPRVAVIGAGFSGLRCAEILGKSGARVTIFEAKDRVGGRVAQSEIGGHLIDLGPNWIHGTQNNPITTIAHETGTHMQDFQSTPLVLSRDGYPLDDSVATKVLEFMWTTVEEAFKYSNTHKDSIPAESSLLDFFRERVERTGFSAEEKEECLELCRLWGSYIGDGVERQSLRFFGLEECLDESTCFVSSTYQRILEYISNAALRHAEIRYNQPVVKIEAQPRTTDHHHQVTLSTANGQTHAFDEVVVTCPLGWLKRNKSAFVPELPPRLSQAIDNISYGRLEKIYVTFPRAFWQDPTPSPNTIPPPNTATTATTAKTARNDLTFALFQNPTYTSHPQDPTIHWNQECMALTTLPLALAHPTLLFYIYGPCSEHITTTITNTTTTTDKTTDKTLDTFLHPFYSRLPGYTATSPTCQPLAYHATTWQADPYAGHGSYTNFQTGLQHGDRDIETLRDADGLGARRGVWFAGEHTAPFVALGTTTGAFWSGERAAAEVGKVYGLGSGSASDELV